MKPLNVVAESLKSLGVDSRAVAQATGIAETNLTQVPSKKCANAPTLGALFAESPDPVTLFERMLKEGTPGFSTDEKLATSLHGLTAALKLAENAEDPQARLAVIVRAVQLAERAGVSKTRQEAAQAFAAWIAGVYLRGIPGGSTKMEVELRVELTQAIEQRDEARSQAEMANSTEDLSKQLEDVIKHRDNLVNRLMAAAQALCKPDQEPAERIAELDVWLRDAEPLAVLSPAGWAEYRRLRVEVEALVKKAKEHKELGRRNARLCAELGVQGGERTAMAAVEQLKENHKRLGERVASAPNVASPMPHYDGTVPIGSWVKHGEDRDPIKSGQVAQIIGIDGGMYAVRRANGQVGIWNFARCVPCDPPSASTSEAKQKKHPEWVRHTKGFNNLKPGTVARVLGVQGDPPDAYMVKRIDGPVGSWIIANCEPCEPPTRPADSSCTCFDVAPCAHCTWYSDRVIDEPDGTPESGKPDEADSADDGLVMAD